MKLMVSSEVTVLSHLSVNCLYYQNVDKALDQLGLRSKLEVQASVHTSRTAAVSLCFEG